MYNKLYFQEVLDGSLLFTSTIAVEREYIFINSMSHQKESLRLTWFTQGIIFLLWRGFSNMVWYSFVDLFSWSYPPPHSWWGNAGCELDTQYIRMGRIYLCNLDTLGLDLWRFDIMDRGLSHYMACWKYILGVDMVLMDNSSTKVFLSLDLWVYEDMDRFYSDGSLVPSIDENYRVITLFSPW